MLGMPWKKFVHPQELYQLEYPSHWDHQQRDEARSCGFGPHERDDVGLWISILPMSVDSERLSEALPELMKQMIEKGDAVSARPDPSLKHTGWKAEMTKEGQGGHYWILMGGDIVVFASSQVPVAERDEWNSAFERVMSSLQITRDDELLYRKVAGEVLTLLREKHPDQEFELDENDEGIRGKNQRVFVTNVYREVKTRPKERERIVSEFVENLGKSFDPSMGAEEWPEIRDKVLPVLKPRDYIDPDSPTKNLYIQNWLADVVICYVIKRNKYYRFLTGWDLNRWEIAGETLHQKAMANLTKLPWPSRLEGCRDPDGGRLVIVMTPDGLASSRLLHPDFHKLFSGPLGTPFWAGIPCRDTLVAYSNRRSLKKRIPRKLRKDHDSSGYPITPKPFLVTADGIAPE